LTPRTDDGIVVVRDQKRMTGMARMGAALRKHLGEDGSADLDEFVREAGAEWKKDVTDHLSTQLALLASRELLTNQVSAVRMDMTAEFAKVRQEMAEGFAQIRKEMAEGLAQVRTEMAEGLAQVRTEMAEGFAQIRKEMADQRVELLRWTFLFWIGQVAATAAIISLALRYAR
jgi:hypothetical protein